MTTATKHKKPGPLLKFFQKHEWCQGEEPQRGKYCLLRAVSKVIRRPMHSISFWPLAQQLGEAVKKEIGPRNYKGYALAKFNDQPRRDRVSPE